MMNYLTHSKRNHPPNFLSSGFVALDIVHGGTVPFGSTGGSCGNVTAILAYMSWNSLPVIRIGRDSAGKFIIDEFKSIGVGTNFLRLCPNTKTPIVIQDYVENSTTRKHRFSFKCPSCGTWLPRYRPVTLKNIEKNLESEVAPDVFYFDRVSPATLKLAQWSRDRGSLVYFEPSSIGEPKNFSRALEVCHILKFAEDRIAATEELLKIHSPEIVLLTKGADGLKVKWRSEWILFKPYKVNNFADASGSGDWCTAGILNSIGSMGSETLRSLTTKHLTDAVQYGQALAAINCEFEGARGSMSALTIDQLNKRVAHVFRHNGTPVNNNAQSKNHIPVDPCEYC